MINLEQVESKPYFLNQYIYPCLENENRLSQEEKPHFMKYSEECIKKAIILCDTTPKELSFSNKLELYCSYISKPTEKESFLGNHKVKILLSAFAACVVALAVLYKKSDASCVNGFYDDWGCATYINGKWVPGECVPNYERYRKLSELCASDSNANGCFHGNYYRELSSECKENPTAALCDGNYDYAKWLNEVKSSFIGRPHQSNG